MTEHYAGGNRTAAERDGAAVPPQILARRFRDRIRTGCGRVPSPLSSFLAHTLTGLTGLGRISELHAGLSPHSPDPAAFAEACLCALQADWNPDRDTLSAIPETGPLTVVANHPFGGIEGLVLLALLSRVRPDVRIMANGMLSLIPELEPACFSVNPFGGPGARRESLAGMKQSLNWLRSGGCLCVFPSGTVSHLSARTGTVSDPDWHPSIGRLVLKTGSAVLPVHFQGANTPLFQVAGLFHPLLRTALLPRELLKKRKKAISYTVGRPVSAKVLSRLGSPDRIISYLRTKTYALTRPEEKKQDGVRLARNMAPVAEPVLRSELSRHIRAIPGENLLVEARGFKVFLTEARQPGPVLHQLGRERERTFRQVGEGTGTPLDIDLYDHSYDHLLLWDESEERIAGAYRIGRIDQLIKRRGGPSNLYTSSLFKYRKGFFRNMTNSLELGRSFVIPELQRDYFPLLLLWKGIGQYLLRNPHYRYLLGPVSISQEYDRVSVTSMLSHLSAHHLDHDLALKVRGRRPPKLHVPKGSSLELHLSDMELDLLNAVVQDIEEDAKGIPVLLRHYLRLGGRIAAFHHDRDFGTFDGLIVLDLCRTDPRVLGRFLGKDAASSFLTGHRQPRLTEPA
jgi:putative hemolysin